ncbi:iron chaperone [Agromyces larvae]|uniref:DUF1801 domain-containing protein n=1 Tax=Agromyces larvae TaxID=2929802 RepID=A0ABY4BYV8_9MICO|nr:DUF1801 domain-containing protein [Agromyces larvae]UOE43919.1 DUF1801 domain-containing protein [Agromyces larvae]
MGDVSDYLAELDAGDRAVIGGILTRAAELVPEATEGRSYGMPALRYRDSPLLSVMRAKGHIGLYPFSPAVIEAFAAELAGVSRSKGTIRFTAEQPLPASLVERIVLARRDEIDAAKSR